jgi:hypothetical protein
MDSDKCIRLKERLVNQSELQEALPIRDFFDGNDDVGSIGCNLQTHPGVEAFRNVFLRLIERPDVEEIYVRVFEVDPGEDSWPFTDIAFVVGKISVDDLGDALASLEPDEVGDADDYGVPNVLKERHHLPILAVWWD